VGKAHRGSDLFGGKIFSFCEKRFDKGFTFSVFYKSGKKEKKLFKFSKNIPTI
jgi:hypothetical protein